jgi:hypothetical protein
MAGIRIPCLAVFGRLATDGERERLARLPDAQVEEWVGDGTSSTSSIPRGSRPGSARSSNTAGRRADRDGGRCRPRTITLVWAGDTFTAPYPER